jgi:hypothetical protein
LKNDLGLLDDFERKEGKETETGKGTGPRLGRGEGADLEWKGEGKQKLSERGAKYSWGKWKRSRVSRVRKSWMVTCASKHRKRTWERSLLRRGSRLRRSTGTETGGGEVILVGN